MINAAPSVSEPVSRLISIFFTVKGKEAAMGAGGNLFGRAISYVVNEIIVEGLANNQSFQRFAVKTSRTLEELSVKAEQSKRQVMEHVKNTVEASRNQGS
ncbi:unnamed protein product [Spirodela intermedia]|uniref:Uncharacterized protein n=1 Tax=Spirodela intermedia TaxID=51605 RepID=A0A7I8KX46_SPIIN|nr:unnamed protein product [Spirodela intermedia]